MAEHFETPELLRPAHIAALSPRRLSRGEIAALYNEWKAAVRRGDNNAGRACALRLMTELAIAAKRRAGFDNGVRRKQEIEIAEELRLYLGG